MARVAEMRYPNGWVEYYTYDKMVRLLSVDDTHPSEKPAKTQKHTYDYDARKRSAALLRNWKLPTLPQ